MCTVYLPEYYARVRAYYYYNVEAIVSQWRFGFPTYAYAKLPTNIPNNSLFICIYIFFNDSSR